MKLIVFLCFVLASKVVVSQSSKIDSVAITVKEMAAANVYEESLSVGFAGTASAQYKRFCRLLSIAGNEQLISLAAAHKNAVVRLYCYQALKQKGAIIPPSLMQQFSTDNTKIKTLNGCIGTERPVHALAGENVFELMKVEE